MNQTQNLLVHGFLTALEHSEAKFMVLKDFMDPEIFDPEPLHEAFLAWMDFVKKDKKYPDDLEPEVVAVNTPREICERIVQQRGCLGISCDASYGCNKETVPCPLHDTSCKTVLEVAENAQRWLEEHKE